MGFLSVGIYSYHRDDEDDDDDEDDEDDEDSDDDDKTPKVGVYLATVGGLLQSLPQNWTAALHFHHHRCHHQHHRGHHHHAITHFESIIETIIKEYLWTTCCNIDIFWDIIGRVDPLY